MITKTLQSIGRRALRAFAVGLLAALGAGPLYAQEPLSPAVIDQINVLLQEKQARTPAQQKISSQLLYALHASRGQVPRSVAKIYIRAADALNPSGSNFVRVVIRGPVAIGFLKQIEQLGGTVTHYSARDRSIAATVPLAALETLAANPDVRRITPAPHVTTNVGALTSQGFISHRANQAVTMNLRPAASTPTRVSSRAPTSAPTTFAPASASAMAIACPRPCAAPVTSATRPSSRKLIVISGAPSSRRRP